MADDQSVVGRRRIYYDTVGNEALICSDSDEEIPEPEEEKHFFTKGEDHLIWRATQDHGLNQEVVNVLCQFIGATPSEIEERSEVLFEKNEKHSGSSDKIESRLSLDKTMDAVLDSFDNLFCRRCLVFDCRLHGCSQNLVFPCEKQPYSFDPDENKKPCGHLCYLRLITCSSGGTGGGGHRRTRRGHRRRRPTGAAGVVDTSVPPEVLPQPPPEAVRAISLPPPPFRRCFFKRSRRIAQAEDDLQSAIVISVVGMGRSGCAAEVSDALASRFDLEGNALDLRRVAPNTFIALLPNVEMADRWLSGGQSLYVPPLRMHIKRWSRQFMANGGGTLPHRLDIELRGLPFHLWGLHTAEQLLDGHCLVHELHLDSVGGSDLSTFKLSVWCDNPEDLPSLLDLHVEEPSVLIGDDPSPPRTVVYPISILISRPGNSPEVLPPLHFSPTPPDPERQNEESDQNSRGLQKRRFNSQSSSDRAPVHARLGPRVQHCSAAGRVFPADTVTALVTPAIQSVSSLMAVDASLPTRIDPADDASFPTLSAPVDAPALPVTSVVGLAAPGPASFPAMEGPANVSMLLDASGVVPAASGPVLVAVNAADYPHEDCSESQESASAPIQEKCGHLCSAAGRPDIVPIDVGVNALVAPAKSSVSSLMTVDDSFSRLGGPVDAPALPDASVVELVAPGTTSFPAEGLSAAVPTLPVASGAGSDVGLDSADYSRLDCSAMMNCSRMGSAAPLVRPDILPGPSCPRYCKPILVYSRRDQSLQHDFDSLADKSAPTSGNVNVCDVVNSMSSELHSPGTLRSSFSNKVVKAAAHILPAPLEVRPGNPISPAVPPRRSRRIAGIGVEFQSAFSDSQFKFKKKIMRALQVIDENEGISQEALDNYCRLFEQPLPPSHVQALAALFGWTPPGLAVC
ncbi:histone-lysine N-methyltransferase EZ2 isoform X4 [Zea mays]|nr:histone-lysine N-methyltransferase EZ2 isoform X4 [Zea mays]|eukprot:XP_020399441.1 histone-lysine N-methyltransferase EZ2 isoform X4 [Zea mays]